MKTTESRESVAKQISRIKAELDRLRSMMATFDPSLPPEEVSGDWIKAILGARRRREKIFGREIFSDAAWDILLELYLSELTNEPRIIADLCRAIGVPGTTGLRWIGELERAGLIVRTSDETDRRRVFIKLSRRGLAAMKEFFQDPQSSAVAV